jgi:hypothetical protein
VQVICATKSGGRCAGRTLNESLLEVLGELVGLAAGGTIGVWLLEGAVEAPVGCGVADGRRLGLADASDGDGEADVLAQPARRDRQTNDDARSLSILAAPNTTLL